MDLDELRQRRSRIQKNSSKHLDNMQKIADESIRVASIAVNTKNILEDLDQRFEQCTALKSLDTAFLFVAVALQVMRQYVFTKFPERLDDQTSAKNTIGHIEEHSARSHRYYNPSLEEIITNPVPFDANVGANGALVGGGVLGHRATAIGHDPLLGLFFGTANIATSTLTNNHLESYHIYTNQNKRDCFRSKANTGTVIMKVKDKLLYEGIEGKKIVGASLMKEIIHLNSDLNTKHSLPLPLVSVINPELASELAKRGLDMSNVVTIGKQVGYSVLINTLIAMMHGLFYDESVDGNRTVYEVRTRKILSYSNIIASTSNVLYVGIGISIGNENVWKSLDIGGLITTIYRIVYDKKFISKLKQEFIQQEYFNLIRGSEYEF